MWCGGGGYGGGGECGGGGGGGGSAGTREAGAAGEAQRICPGRCVLLGTYHCLPLFGVPTHQHCLKMHRV